MLVSKMIRRRLTDPSWTGRVSPVSGSVIIWRPHQPLSPQQRLELPSEALEGPALGYRRVDGLADILQDVDLRYLGRR